MHEHISGAGGRLLGLSLEPGAQVAGFTLEALLATGGSGSVYLARRGAQRVALKLVPRDAWGEREVDALRHVRHAPVVNLLGYGLWPEQRPHFLVLTLEFVEGLALDAWAREHNPSARQVVRQVLLPLTSALAQVHAAGVVHRDIKEANVIMRAEDGRPVLVDFGAARHDGAERLTERLPPGTREYRSPELLRFAREWDGSHYASSPMEDLWALGVTLYWLLTRELPFGDRDGPLVQRILEQAPQPVHELNPRVPQALGEVCLRMLEKDPSARYPTAEALTEALTQALDQADDTWDVPLQPGPPPSPASSPPASSPPSAEVRPHSLRDGTTRRGWSGIWLAVLLAIMGLLPWNWVATPPTPRAGLPALRPPLQDTRSQELASAPPTGEVASGARPSRLSPPAPVARTTLREQPAMPKLLKSRAPLAAAASLATCVGVGCVSAPQTAVDPPPSPIACPAGAAQTFHAHHLNFDFSLILAHESDMGATVRNGAPIRAELDLPSGDLPVGTPVLGRIWFGRDRVYGRFTELILPSGEHQPICFDLIWNGLGVPMRPGHTGTTARIEATPGAAVVPESMHP